LDVAPKGAPIESNIEARFGAVNESDFARPFFPARRLVFPGGAGPPGTPVFFMRIAFHILLSASWSTGPATLPSLKAEI